MLIKSLQTYKILSNHNIKWEEIDLFKSLSRFVLFLLFFIVEAREKMTNIQIPILKFYFYIIQSHKRVLVYFAY